MSEKNTALLRAYLVIGDDQLKRERVLERLKGYVNPAFFDFNYEKKDSSSDMNPEALQLSLESLPFGESIRLLVVDGGVKLAKESSDYLVEYLVNPNPSTVLCLLLNSLPKSTRLYKAFEQLGKDAIIDCSSKKAYQLPEYIKKMAASYGFSIALDAAQELVSRVGESTQLLNAQLVSLTEYCHDRTVITIEDVKAHVARSAEVKPWDFLDALSARDLRRSLELFNAMDRSSLVGLHALMLGRIRELICAKALDERGQASQLCQELNKQDWQVKNHIVWSRKFTSTELAHALSRAAQLERVLKGTGDDVDEFTRFIIMFCETEIE